MNEEKMNEEKMNFFDPVRPQIAGRPSYVRGTSSILPTMTVSLRPNGLCEVMVFVPMSPTRMQPRWKEMGRIEFANWMNEYEDDPEGMLRETFDWREEEMGSDTKKETVKPKGEVQGRIEASADDLGF